MHGPVTQNSGGDELLKKAQASALMGAFSVSGLKPTITVPGGSINITDPSENMTILANGPAGCSGTACGFNVLNLQDLVLSNGTLYLTSTYTGTPDAPLPTLVVNINGRFKLSGGSKIVLQAHMTKYTRSIT